MMHSCAFCVATETLIVQHTRRQCSPGRRWGRRRI